MRRIILCLLSFIVGCNSSPNLPQNLKQAVAHVKYRSSPRGLRGSMFHSTYPEHKPSDYVNFYFSTLGAAERPVPEYFPQGEAEKLGLKESPPLPDDVEVVFLEVNSDFGNQIVLRADDVKGILIADAYTDPSKPPVGTVSWPFP